MSSMAGDGDFCRQLRPIVPFGEEFGAAFDAEAVADVVAENDVVDAGRCGGR
jgi:hypothetical protein